MNKKPSLSNQPMQEKKRRGIASNVSLGLTTMVCLLVTLSAVALWGFYEFRAVLTEFSNTTLPQMTYGAKLSSQLNHLLFLTERLSKAETEPGRRIVNKAITFQFQRIKNISSNIDYGNRRLEANRQLEALDATLEELDTIVKARIKAIEKVDNVALAVLSFGEYLMRQENSPKSLPENEYEDTTLGHEGPLATAWLYQTMAMGAMGLKVYYQDSLNSVRHARKVLAKEFDKLRALQARMPDALQQRVEPLSTKLEKELMSKEGLLALKEALIRVTAKSTSRGNFARGLVEEVVSVGTDLFVDMNMRVSERSAELTYKLQRRMLFFGIMSLMALIIGVLILVLLIKRVVRRLVGLNTQVLLRVAGQDNDIMVSGNDEISDIASSINYFATELRVAKEVAERSSEAKSRFLAHMSHEIRTPMNAIIGLSDLALKGEIEPKMRDYLQKVRFSARSLLDILNDILDISKIESGKFSLETAPFFLEEIFENLSGIIGVSAEEKGLEIVYNVDRTIPLILLGDALRLGQVLINLVNNSVKFTDSGHIIIGVRVVNDQQQRPKRKHGLKLEFCVADTGIGLTQEQQLLLFKPFQQADTSTTRKYGGTGLGLSISKTLVELMGGEINVRSEYGVGSTFSFTAVFEVQEPMDYCPAELPEDMREKRVLIVDDNSASRQMLVRQLSALSLIVEPFVDGVAVLEHFQREHPPYDLMLVDWSMPHLDGLALLSRLHSDSALRNIPAILMASTLDQEHVRLSGPERVRTLLQKPIIPSQLFNCITQAFGRPQAALPLAWKTWKDTSHAHFVNIRGARVLVVEDNELNQQVAKEHVQSVGLVVSIAANGLEAVEAVKNNEYDLILMDIQMPEMDGCEAAKAIRRYEKDKGLVAVPIVAMSAHAHGEDRVQCEKSGMNDYLSKPFVPEVLHMLLLKWISAREGGEEFHMDVPVPLEQDVPDLRPVMDVEKALRYHSGSFEVFRKYLARFIVMYENVESQAREALHSTDPTALKRFVHTIKGLVGALGADPLVYECSAMEDLLASEDILDNRKRVEQELESCLQHVQDLIRVGKPFALSEAESEDMKKREQGDVADEPVSMESLDTLVESLRNGDLDAVQLFDAQKGALAKLMSQQQLQQLERLMDDYDFDETLSLLLALKAKVSS